jgi:glycosyltransferase involved in cell wall biosynthesis
MKILQILLSQSEAGAETYFEKVAAAFQENPDLQQRLIIEAQASREQRLKNVDCDFVTLPMDKFGKTFLYTTRLNRASRHFNPDLTLTWVNRASRKAPPTKGITVGRLGGYYDIANYSRCDHLIVNAPDLVRHVVESGWPEAAVSLISNFGEIPEKLQIDEDLPELPEGVPVLLTLGRLHAKKAQDVLIKAMPLIADAHLLIAGSGELRAELEQLAEDCGVANRVHFLGLRKDTARLFQLADICVFPSRFEPLGNVVMEAWAMKCPIVAADSSGPKWLIEDGVDGLLFPVDDVAAYAERVSYLLANRDLCERLVTAGNVTLDERFSKPVIIKQYLDLFEGLLEGRIAKAQ